jgi:hypothetical protein
MTMTTSGIATITASVEGSRPADAASLASAIGGRARTTSVDGPGRAADFGSVLAAESASPVAAHDQGDGVGRGSDDHEPAGTAHPASPGVADPQPDHGRDDEHATGRTRSHGAREASGAAGSDRAPDAGPGAAATGDPTATDDPTAGSATPVSGATDASDPAGPSSASSSGKAAKGPRRGEADDPGTPATLVTAADLAAVAAPIVAAPAIASRGAGIRDDRAPANQVRNPGAATGPTPVTPALSAGTAAAGGPRAAVLETSAVPAHRGEAGTAAGSGTVPAATSGDAAGRPTGQVASPADATGADAGPAVGTADTPVALPIRSTAEPATGSIRAMDADSPANPVVPGQWPAIPATGAAGRARGRGPTGTLPGRTATGVDAGRQRYDAGSSDPAEGGAAADATGTPTDIAAAHARARASAARIAVPSPVSHATAGTDGQSVQATDVLAGVAGAGGTPVDPALAGIAGARGAVAAGAAAGPDVGTSQPSGVAAGVAADRVVAEAMDRIRTTSAAGVPGLESRIDDPELGAIRVVVSARLGETIRAELVVRDSAAAHELSTAIERAVASGATLPAGVDLRVRAEGPAKGAGHDAHLGPGAGGQGQAHPGAQGQAFEGDPRRDHATGFAFGHDAGRGDRPANPLPGRGRGIEPIPIATSSIPVASRPGSALDVRA